MRTESVRSFSRSFPKMASMSSKTNNLSKHRHQGHEILSPNLCKSLSMQITVMRSSKIPSPYFSNPSCECRGAWFTAALKLSSVRLGCVKCKWQRLCLKWPATACTNLRVENRSVDNALTWLHPNVQNRWMNSAQWRSLARTRHTIKEIAPFVLDAMFLADWN